MSAGPQNPQRVFTRLVTAGRDAEGGRRAPAPVRALMRAAPLAALLLAAPPLAAQDRDFSGLYRPVGEAFEGWTCTEETIGRDGGALAVQDGKFFGLESVCELTNPVNIRDMNARLFDAVCTGEGEQYSYRLMLMKTEDGLIFAQDGFAFELISCEAAEGAEASGEVNAQIGGEAVIGE